MNKEKVLKILWILFALLNTVRHSHCEQKKKTVRKEVRVSCR